MPLFKKKEKNFNPLTINPPEQDEYEDEISNNIQQNYQQYQQQFQQPTQQMQPIQQIQQQPQRVAIIRKVIVSENSYKYIVETNYPLKLGYCRLEN